MALARKFNDEVVRPQAAQLDRKVQEDPDYLPLEFIEEANRWGLYTLWIPRIFGGKGYNLPSCSYFIEEIADQYESAEKITLVVDNLNTHVPGSLYETFAPDKARALWDRFEFVYTPKHGSWLNMAEIELNVLTGQCLARRLDDIDRVRREVEAWERYRDNKNAKINWRFTTPDARIKLSRLYPTLDD